MEFNSEFKGLIPGSLGL